MLPSWPIPLTCRGKKNRPESQKIPQHLSFKHTLTLCPQNRGHRRGSGKKSPVQTSEYVSCNSDRAGSGTRRSGRSAKTPTAQKKECHT